MTNPPPSPASADGSHTPPAPHFTAFAGHDRVASGSREAVTAWLRDAARTGATGDRAVLVFDDRTGRQTDLDLREPAAASPAATEAAADAGAPSGPARGPGRPRLGVVAREVTLLPRHWDWLNHQPGGASVALRRLVDEARRANAWQDDMRSAREAAYAFMSAIAGDLPQFEDAARALFAGDAAAFGALLQAWPPDVRVYAHKLAGAAFSAAPDGSPPPPCNGTTDGKADSRTSS